MVNLYAIILVLLRYMYIGYIVFSYLFTLFSETIFQNRNIHHKYKWNIVCQTIYMYNVLW